MSNNNIELAADEKHENKQVSPEDNATPPAQEE